MHVARVRSALFDPTARLQNKAHAWTQGFARHFDDPSYGQVQVVCVDQLVARAGEESITRRNEGTGPGAPSGDHQCVRRQG